MTYQPEKWQPKVKVVDVFLIALENIEDIKNLLGATSVRQAYNRNRTILIEWTMMHRETFSGLVGQYIVRNDRGEFDVLDPAELREDYVPFVEEVTNVEAVFEHAKLGRLLAVHETEGEVDGVVFELPNGNAESFDIRKDVEQVSEVEVDEEVPEEPQQERKVPAPGHPRNKHHNNKENN